MYQFLLAKIKTGITIEKIVYYIVVLGEKLFQRKTGDKSVKKV